MQKKIRNTYIKYVLLLLLCTAIGGVTGAVITWVNMDGIGTGAQGFILALRTAMLPLLLVLFLLDVIIGETVLKVNAALGRQLENAQDEEGDAIEYNLELMSAIALISGTAISVLSLIILSTGYSMDYIANVSGNQGRRLMGAFVVFVIGNAYHGWWQLRYIKGLQKLYPENNADPTSRKFQEQWLACCDEAERELIYQSSYKSYLFTTRLVSLLTFAALLTHLIWDTGIAAVIFLGIVWIGITASYCTSCVRIKRRKLNT